MFLAALQRHLPRPGRRHLPLPLRRPLRLAAPPRTADQPAADARQVGARSLPGEDPGDPPAATAASNSATPSVAMAGTATSLVARPQDSPEHLAAPHQRLRQQRPTIEMQRSMRGTPRHARRPAEPARSSMDIRPVQQHRRRRLPVEDRRPRRVRTARPASSGSNAVGSRPSASGSGPRHRRAGWKARS